jgi:hypothetical protein
MRRIVRGAVQASAQRCEADALASEATPGSLRISICAHGRSTTQHPSVLSPSPFALSLSKGWCRRAQAFDKLSPNGEHFLTTSSQTAFPSELPFVASTDVDA